MIIERWQQATQPARQHRFTRTRRADQKKIVSTCGRNLQRPFPLLLSHNLAEILWGIGYNIVTLFRLGQFMAPFQPGANFL